MKRKIMALGAVLAWVCGVFGATHEGVQLWENGPLWAKTNVGANSPTETGYYFWWGDTLGYKWQNSKWVASDGSVNNFSFSTANCPTYGKSLAQLQSMGAVGTDGNLLPAYDAAAQQWGDDWRVPKASELKNLMDLCTWTWTTNNNVVGYTVTGKGLYSSNSVFFPLGGYGSTTNLTSATTTIYMWSATAEGNTSYRPCWTATSRGGASNTGRPNGYPIRPVKSMSAAKAASAVALDTRTGTRVVKTTESLAYDVAWGGASSGTLKVNGTAVSGLSSKGNYSWTPNTSQTNYWKLAYTAGTANYSATFKHLANYAITYADTKGATNTNPTQYNYDSSITFAALPNVTGYVFSGWNPTKIAAGGFGAKTVTAKWTPISYAVKFNANGGSGTMANLAMTYGTAKALTANAFTRTGYTFKGWATSSGATSAAYTDKQSVNNLTSTANGTVNLYAVWQVNTYTVKFNANGGSGTTAQLACTYGQGASLTANAFTRAGYAFVGWMTAANGTTVAYTDKQSVLNLSTQANATINLYARWTDKWYVDAEAGDDTNQGDSASQAFKTIQHAIDKSVEGMAIIVADGTYAPINSNNKAITIQSVNGAERTIIDGGYPAVTNRCVYAGGNNDKTNTVVRGFTMLNGCSVGLSSGINGAGVAGGTLYDCVVKSNHAGGCGGGVAHSVMYDCTICDNDAQADGGGAYRSQLENCLLSNNRCEASGAGANGSVLINCSVISNRAEKTGGGVYGGFATNCVFQCNEALEHGGGVNGSSLYGCIVTNNVSWQNGGGVRAGTVIKSVIVGNESYGWGGGAYGATIYDSEITSNKSTIHGGGTSSGKCYNCIIADNECGRWGGGVFRGELQNCIVYGNKAPNENGGGIASAIAINSTIYDNSCGGRGGGVSSELWDGVPSATNFNCIVYGNTAGTDNEIDTRVMSFNCYTNDPHFIRAEAGDFRLRYNSPCINAGNNAYVTNTVDFAGNARIDNNTVDIGAYEYSASDDTNFTVQVANGTGGAIYYEGDTVTVAAEDRSPRYAFTRWTGDVSVLANANSMTNTFTMPTRNLSFTAEYDDLQSYLVIDLSGGPNAASYPVSNLTDIPSGGWTDEYKTTKLVLRRIDPGTFTMGAPTGEAGRLDSDETPHQVTLTHSYYIGVFELTQRQWELVMGDRPSGFSNTVCYAARPVENISYNQIRGADLGKWWPQMNAVDEASFMGKLRAKTGRLFDLPTEAQWEYACRAGTTTALNSGKNLSAASGVDANMAEVGRYYYNSGSYNNSYDYNGSTDETGTAKVGSYLPNAWGLYDMHGNVGEFCLDWFGAATSVATDPVGRETGSERSLRGGTWGNYSSHCRSGAHRLRYSPSAAGTIHGLRVVVNFANFSQNQVVNLSATDGTDPAGVRLTWTAVPGTENYCVWTSETSSFDDAVKVAWPTTNTYLHVVQDTNTHWYWVQSRIDGKYRTVSASDSGYRVKYQLTVAGGTGSTNCFANTTVPIVANAAPTGYSFKEWTGTAADVALVTSKTSASTTFKMPGRAVTLTATYKANGYTVKFNANKGAGTMENESFTYDVAKALTANAFTRTGYAYQGWATTAAGSKVYSDKQTVSNLTAAANGTVNLYAVWQANTYAVKFNANGGTGTMANESFTYDAAKALTANAFTRTGYTYQGWATSADWDAAYANKQTVSNLTATANGTVNLYAVWTANPYTVTFNANGGTGAAMASQGFTYGTAQNLSNGSYTRTGYTFLGWSTNPQATSAAYADGASVSNLATGGTLALYAVWRPNAYTIRFLPNGAEGEMSDQAATYDTAANLKANAFTKEGFGFVGWTTGGDSATVSYTNRQQVLNIATNDGAVVTLSAKWTDTWYVDATNGNDANEGVSAVQPFQTIQHAIDQSVDGMTIIVADGTYAPIRTDNMAITIQSVNGAASTIIDGGYPAATNRCVMAGGTAGKTNTVIRGFAIQNGCTFNFTSGGDGAGVIGGTLYDCIVRANHGRRYGGGVAYSVMYDCTISDNNTIDCGGAAYRGLLTNCDLVNNSCGTTGAGAYNGILINCSVISNRADMAAGGVFSAALTNCYIQGNVALETGGGVRGGTLYNCIITNNIAYLHGGGVYVGTVTKCVVVGNQAYQHGGGVHTATCYDSEIIGNTATISGGGANSVKLYNCVVANNECALSSTGYGGGAYNGVLENCLIYGNRATEGAGGGVSHSVCRNCTIYGNRCGYNSGGTHAWLVDGVSVSTNYNCIVYGNSAGTSDNNIDSRMASFNSFTGNPRFVDAANGDFRLLGDSPCIDMGNNRYVSGETDVRGNARIQNGIVDIGAYEFTLPTGLGNVPVEGTDAAVPVEWLGAYGCVDEDSTPASLQQFMAQAGDNGMPLWQSWVAGLDPWNPDSQLMANIAVVGDEVEVSWTPDLSNAEPKRHYTVMGKTNLTDTAWVIPVNEEHRFFKVTVTMGEPGIARDVAATAGTSAGDVSISWSAVDWAVGYNIYRSTVDNFSQATLLASTTDTAYVDATALPGTWYYYWIVSVANGGEWMTSASAAGCRKIGVPRNVAASDGTSADWITVTWNAVEGAVSYRILRATTEFVEDAVEVGTSAGTSWMDLNAANGVTYNYWVVAVGASFEGEASASDVGYLRLAVPEGVTASNGGFADRVKIAWNAVAEASHYRVYRSASASGSKTPVSGWQTALNYSDTTAEPGVTYWYFVVAAADGEGRNASGYSAGAAGSLKIGAPTGVYATDGTSAAGVTVSWNATPGAEGYKVYRGTANNPDAAEVVSSVSSVSFDDTTAAPGTLYFYWVTATNAVSESAKSAVETGFRSIPAPTGVTATTTSGAAAVTVSWQPVDGAAYYRVYRGTRTGSDYAVEIDTTTETTYADESGAADKTYYYSVKAVGASCDSDFSDFVSGKR
ncbi:MAG: InlB B-repeat-containing protein [Kiritimatiellae bacterium]|nr:InlB B-repeat-containing protein [Kiritimatiellia bacterium]